MTQKAFISKYPGGCTIILSLEQQGELAQALRRACSTWEDAPKWLVQLSDAAAPQEGIFHAATYEQWSGTGLTVVAGEVQS